MTENRGRGRQASENPDRKTFRRRVDPDPVVDLLDLKAELSASRDSGASHELHKSIESALARLSDERRVRDLARSADDLEREHRGLLGDIADIQSRGAAEDRRAVRKLRIRVNEIEQRLVEMSEAGPEADAEPRE